MKNLILLIMGLLLLSSIGACSDDDNIEQTEDLFRPKWISGYPKSEGNVIKLYWYKVLKGESYTIEIAEDNLFENIIIEETTTELNYTSESLPYSTKFYVRIRTNAARPENNSIWNDAEISTEDRDIPLILKEVSDEDIYENAAVVRWNVDSQYLVDCIEVKDMDNPESVATLIEITEDDFKNASYRIENLESSTRYSVTLYNNQAENVYDRPYNTVSFKTAGPPEGARVITENDDLASILLADQADATVADGQVYYIRSGGSYEITGFEFTKGFTITGSLENVASVTLKQHFSPASENAGVITISNVMLKGEDCLISNESNDGKAYHWKGIDMSKCTVSGFPNGIFKLNTSAGLTKRIENININQCIFDGIEGGRFLELDNFSDQSMVLAEIQNVTITNTTFMRSPGVLFIFIPDAYGYSGSNFNLTMENVTVCGFGKSGSSRFIQMNRLPKTSTVTVTNCLLSNEAVAQNDTYMFYETCLCGSATTSYSNNYTTGSLAETGRKSVSAKSLGIAQKDLFENPDEGDLTIKAKSSVVYTDKIGDTRWIK